MNLPADATASRAVEVLLVEDNPFDAELIQHELLEGRLHFTIRRCASEADMRQALAGIAPDLILADYKLPGFSGAAAMALARQTHPDVPFIFVSGAIGEGNVAELLRDGATDYVRKDNLARLAPVVTRALREKQLRAEARRAVQGLREAIAVLRGTRRSFKSKALGQLRERLENLVGTTPWW